MKQLRTYEFIQRYENGGHPVNNDDTPFEHGEGVLVVSKRELVALFRLLLPLVGGRGGQPSTPDSFNRAAAAMQEIVDEARYVITPDWDEDE